MNYLNPPGDIIIKDHAIISIASYTIPRLLMILLTAVYITITFLIELNPYSENCVIAVIERH